MRLHLASSLAVFTICSALAAGDLTITFDATTKGMMGTGSKGQEVQYYTADFNLVRNEKTQTDTLVDFQKGITYLIDHKKKRIQQISFDDALAAMDAMSSKSKAQASGAAAMMGKLFGDPDDVKVEPGGSETVAGHACQDYRITVGKLVTDISVDPNLKPPVPDAAYARMLRARALQAANAGPMGAVMTRLALELGKIKGFQLKIHQTGLMGTDTLREATKVASDAIPASLFVLPSYPVEDQGKKMRESMAGPATAP